MKKRSNNLLLGFGLVALVVVIGAVVAGNKALSAHSEAVASAVTCTSTGKTYTVTIKDDAMQPSVITAHRCDKMTITNLDPTTREIGFGNHDHHVAYDGISEKVLQQNQSLSITFVETGSCHFHDHFHDEVEGFFTVY